MQNHGLKTVFSLLMIAILAIDCRKLNPTSSDLDKKYLASLDVLGALPKRVKSPADNPITAEKVRLGKLLFYDPILSGEKDVACASCHHPQFGYAEFLDVSIGVGGQGLGSKRQFKPDADMPFVKRNSQTLLNTAFNGINVAKLYDPSKAPMFWDVRSNSLEKQALEPIKSLEEMRGHNYLETDILSVIVDRLNHSTGYKELFAVAFPQSNIITQEDLGKALAAFQRTLVTNNSRFDFYMRGDESAISSMEKEGLILFREVGCVNCHNGPMFSDYKAHVIGVKENDKITFVDKGIDSLFGFRTPSLRNLRFTAPYMHNGTMMTLQEVLEFYQDLSNGVERNSNISATTYDPLIEKIDLKVSDMSSIISFLNTLNDDSFDKEIPEHVPSGLLVGGDINR